jgi:hypothetical protein
MGLLLLMFSSGAETKHLFGREDRRQVGWLVFVGIFPVFSASEMRPTPMRSFTLAHG